MTQSDNALLATSPEANAKMFISIAVIMLGSIVYGIDNQISGIATGYEGFIEDWCFQHYGGAAVCNTTDPGDGSDKTILTNKGWQHSFMFWSGFLIYIGAGIAVLTVAPTVCNNLGRRAVISIGGIITVVACVGCGYLSANTVMVYFLWRLLMGFGIGMMCFGVPIYNSETATASWRGTTGAAYQFSVCLGQTIGSLCLASNDDWHFAMLLPAFAAGVVSGLVWLVPESPRWIMQKHGYERGLTVLKRVRAGDVTAEAREMELKINEQKSMPSLGYKDLWGEKSLRFRVFVASWLQLAQKFTFIDPIFAFWSTICFHMNIDDADKTNVIFTFLGMVGSVFSFILMDTKFGGRKNMLLLASSLVMLADVLLVFLRSPGPSKIVLYVWIFGWQLAWGSVCWLLPSELFSLAEKGPALGVSTFVQFAFNPLAGIVASNVMSANFPAFFILAAAAMACHILFVCTCVRETKGVPLEQVPALYGAVKPSDPMVS